MKKIQTIFERDWSDAKNHPITRTYVKGIAPQAMKEMLEAAVATEKLDGMNVRITVRNHIVVRVEKRRNPDKIQKAKGIEDPWYVDADEYGPEDKYIYEGLKNVDWSQIPDGEHSGELLGPNVQGNRLNLDKNVIVFFFLNQAPVFEDVPVDYEGLAEWLPAQKSKYGNGPIEGIVWHTPFGLFKIKVKDFKHNKP